MYEGKNWPGGSFGRKVKCGVKRYYKKKNIRMSGINWPGGKFWPKGEVRCKRYYKRYYKKRNIRMRGEIDQGEVLAER